MSPQLRTREHTCSSTCGCPPPAPVGVPGAVERALSRIRFLRRFARIFASPPAPGGAGPHGASPGRRLGEALRAFGEGSAAPAHRARASIVIDSFNINKGQNHRARHHLIYNTIEQHKNHSGAPRRARPRPPGEPGRARAGRRGRGPRGPAGAGDGGRTAHRPTRLLVFQRDLSARLFIGFDWSFGLKRNDTGATQLGRPSPRLLSGGTHRHAEGHDTRLCTDTVHSHVRHAKCVVGRPTAPTLLYAPDRGIMVFKTRRHGLRVAKPFFDRSYRSARGAARGRTYRMQQLRGSISVRSPMRARRRHCRGAEGAAIDSDGSGCAPVAPWRFQKRFGGGGLGRGGGLGGQLNRPIRRVTA